MLVRARARARVRESGERPCCPFGRSLSVGRPRAWRARLWRSGQSQARCIVSPRVCANAPPVCALARGAADRFHGLGQLRDAARAKRAPRRRRQQARWTQRCVKREMRWSGRLALGPTWGGKRATGAAAERRAAERQRLWPRGEQGAARHAAVSAAETHRSRLSIVTAIFARSSEGIQRRGTAPRRPVCVLTARACVARRRFAPPFFLPRAWLSARAALPRGRARFCWAMLGMWLNNAAGAARATRAEADCPCQTRARGGSGAATRERNKIMASAHTRPRRRAGRAQTLTVRCNIAWHRLTRIHAHRRHTLLFLLFFLPFFVLPSLCSKKDYFVCFLFLRRRSANSTSSNRAAAMLG